MPLLPTPPDGVEGFPRPLGVKDAPHAGDVPSGYDAGAGFDVPLRLERRHPEARLVDVPVDDALDLRPADEHLARAFNLIRAAYYLAGEQRRASVEEATRRIAMALRAIGERRYVDAPDPDAAPADKAAP